MENGRGDEVGERRAAIGASAAVLILFLSIGGLTQMMNAAFGLFFVPFILFGGVTWITLRRQGRAPLAAAGARPFSPFATWLGFLFGLANFFALVVPLQFLTSQFVPPELLELYDSTHVFEGQTPLELGLIVLAVVVAAPMGEEFFFRGFLQRALTRSAVPPVRAVVITAAIFSAFHLDPVGFLARVELGVLFGLLLLYTGSLWPAVAAHAANNLISTVIYFAGKNSPEAAASAEPELAQLALLVGAGALGLYGVFRWAVSSGALRGAPEAEAATPSAAPPRSLLALSAPWIIAGLLSIGLVAAVDPQGVRLNLFDARHRLPKVGPETPAKVREQREQLKRLRQEVRFGDGSLEAYQEKRRELMAPKPPAK